MITQERLKQLLHYDPETGVFTWKVKRKRANPGAVGGYIRPDGYLIIRIDWKGYLAHRLAWLYVNGSFPSKQIDHRNGVKDDNRIANLREATPSQNQFNTAVRSKPSSLPKGVTKNNKGYIARICDGTQRVYLGFYKCPTAAYAAYCHASKSMHGSFSRIG